jgi:signal peptidase II
MPSPPASGPTPPDGAGRAQTGDRRPRLARFLAYRWLWLLAGVVLVLDQLTKYWISRHLPFGSYGAAGHAVIPGFFNLVHVGNTGAAWSMFAGRSAVLAVLAGATLLAIHFWRRQLGLRQPAAQLAFGLLCGGIVGNLVDRLAYGHVIDFIDLHFGAYIYPTFNVADSAICVGVFWYVLWSLRQPVHE